VNIFPRLESLAEIAFLHIETYEQYCISVYMKKKNMLCLYVLLTKLKESQLIIFLGMIEVDSCTTELDPHILVDTDRVKQLSFLGQFYRGAKIHVVCNKEIGYSNQNP
jgi:hypothetical protein